MKLILSIQFVLSILLLLVATGLMADAFISGSMVLWKAFTILTVVFSVKFIKQCYKELTV